mgnify:CR=1 FL=1
MSTAKRRVAIVGVGTTAKPGNHHPTKTWKDLAADAAYEALADAHMGPRELDAAVAAYHGEGVSEAGGLGAGMADCLGIAPKPCFVITANCCGGSVALIEGYNFVASGQYDKVLVLGGDKDGDNIGYTENINISFDTEYDYMFGFRHRDAVELMGNVYLQKHGYNDYGPFAALSYQTHWFARRNPKASAYGLPMPTRESLNNGSSLYSMMGEGSAACILVPEEDAYKYTDKPIFIEGFDYVTTSHYTAHRLGEEPMGNSFPDYVADRTDTLDISVPHMITAHNAYKMAGITAEDVDVAQVYDLVILPLFLIEALGLCERGEAGRALMRGDFFLGGKCPVNTDGGNIARGHSSGADGLNQIVENVYQLRGEAGERQVEGAKCAVASNVGSAYSEVATIVLGNEKFTRRF